MPEYARAPPVPVHEARHTSQGAWPTPAGERCGGGGTYRRAGPVSHRDDEPSWCASNAVAAPGLASRAWGDAAVAVIGSCTSTADDKGKGENSFPFPTYSARGDLRQDPGRAAESPAEARTCGDRSGFCRARERRYRNPESRTSDRS